jgi:hypothetical protein
MNFIEVNMNKLYHFNKKYKNSCKKICRVNFNSYIFAQYIRTV